MNRLLVKCVYNGFTAELKVGNYYCALPCILDNGFYYVNGIKDKNGWPIQFPAHCFVVIS